MKLKALILVFLIFLLSIPVANAEDALDWYTRGTVCPDSRELR